MTQTDPSQSTLTKLYSALLAALVFSFWPSVTAALMALIFATGVLVAAYIYRGKSEEGSLLHNHTTYLIRTIWVGSFFALITTSIASFYMITRIDSMPMMACLEPLARQMQEGTVHLDQAMLMEMIAPCWDQYMDINRQTFITSGAIAVIPVLLYFVIRLVRGFTRAMKGVAITKPKAWF